MKYLGLALSCMLFALPCSAEIIIVDDDWPYDFNNIQAAIDYSADGDTIYVFPGTYSGPGNWDIDFNGRAVTVQSVDPYDPYIVAATVIDCNDVNYHTGFEFLGGEDVNSALAGLTITRARRAIRCMSSSPTISYCNLIGNSELRDAGGIYLGDSNSTISNSTITDNIGSGIYCTLYSDPIIANCIIARNTGWGLHGGTQGGGIYCNSSSPTIENCLITANAVDQSGGGIYTSSNCSPKIVNCTVTGNAAGYHGGGIYHSSDKELFVSNSIIWSNADNSGDPIDVQQIYNDGEGPVNMWFSCVQDGDANDANIPFGGADYFNIDDDPCFVIPGVGYWDDNNTPGNTDDDFWVWTEGDYHLRLNSPCIEAGNPYSTYGPGDTDIDGQSRVMGSVVDMGVDEAFIVMITVTKPAGGEVWTAASTHQIEWDSFGITGTVDVSYSINNGLDWIPIANTLDTGSYPWLLPAPVDSNQCLVSVEPNIYDPNAVCTASVLFSIIPYSAGLPIAAKWKSLGGDFDRSGRSAHFGPELGCIKWQFQTSAPVSASVTVADNNTVHIACEDGNLYTLDANDGSLLWTYEVNSPLLSSPTIGLDGTVYVGAQNGILYAIDVNGDLQWTHTTSGFIYSSPAVSPDGNSIYVGSQDGSLYALGRDGSDLWTFQTDGPGIATGAIFASPAVGPDGTVYIAGVYDPNLYALDPDTGSVIWDCNFLDPCDPNTEKPWPFASPVVAPDGTIYQALLYNPKREIVNVSFDVYGFWYDSKFYAIDPNDGQILWATNMSQTATEVELPDPEPPEPNYWFEQYYSDIMREESIPPYPYTISKAAGKDFVRYYRVSNSSYSEPALGSDETIYVSLEDPYIRAVDPNGAIKGVTSLGWFGGFSLTVGADGLIYAAGDDGYLYVVDPDNTEIARYQACGQLSFPVITQDGTIIVNDANNIVTAIIDGDCPGQPPALHRPEDLNADWQMNFFDFSILAADWLDCTDTSYDPETRDPYCDYDGNDIFLLADINWDHYVDAFDLAQLAMRWLAQD